MIAFAPLVAIIDLLVLDELYEERPIDCHHQLTIALPLDPLVDDVRLLLPALAGATLASLVLMRYRSTQMYHQEAQTTSDIQKKE